MSYKRANLEDCHWCNGLVHKKCLNGYLGCIKCCDKMIPGFRYNAADLLEIEPHRNLKLFNPYNREDLINNIGNRIRISEENSEIWSDISEKLTRCTYITPQEVLKPAGNELSVLSMNIRSIQKNVEKINDNILEYSNYDIIALNETNCSISNLPNGIDDILITGFYPPEQQPPARKSGKGGGLLTYVNKRLCGSADDIVDFNSGIETNTTGEFLITKVTVNKNVSMPNTIMIINVYRSPSSNANKFLELLEENLNLLRNQGRKTIILAGDFNIDLINFGKDEISKSLINLTASYGLAPIISRPTRVTDHSATLIDHIYINKVEKIICSNVVTFDLSDHLGTYIKISIDPQYDSTASIGTNLPCNETRTIDDENRSAREHDTMEYRIINEANNEIFSRLIHDESWSELAGLRAEARYDKFNDIYSKHYDTAYPLNTKRVRRKHERVHPKPWITPWLEDACHRKNLLYKTYIKTNSIQNKTTYDKMNKFCTKHIDKAKKKYYRKYFDEHCENFRKQWQMINSILKRNVKKATISRLIDQEGNVASNSRDIAEKFNEYFCNIANDLKNNIGSYARDRSYKAFLNDPVPLSIFLRPADHSEIMNIINSLKNKSTRDTKISALKIAAENSNFIEALASTITLSLEEGVFPQSLKVARVVPIHKSGPKTAVSNYRPISLLATFSKIYEKVMHARITEFLNKNSSLHERQYGFRAGRSCEHALLDAQNILLNSLHRNQISLLLLIDFSKAFDMVDHSILLHKLQHYGIRGVAHQWMASYLKNRNQFVSVGGFDSTCKNLEYGVPQGSILGPLLFVIYINDLPGMNNLAQFILYADDANIIISGNSTVEIEEKINILCERLMEWVRVNGLLINLKKTNYMLFSRKSIANLPRVVMNNVNITRVDKAKFLGVILDDKLSWTAHIDAMKTKMSRYVGIMYRIKPHLPLKVRVQIYQSFIQSHLNYCSLVWGFSPKSSIESLFRQQKKGIRAVMPGPTNYYYRDGNLPTGTKMFFNEHSILTVHGIIASNAMIFMNKFFHFPSLLPIYVKNTISINVPTRNDGANIPDEAFEWFNYHNTAQFRQSLFLKGPLLFIDTSISEAFNPISCQSVNAFKSQCKRTILKLQGQGEAHDWSSSKFPIFLITGLRKSKRTHLA